MHKLKPVYYLMIYSRGYIFFLEKNINEEISHFKIALILKACLLQLREHPYLYPLKASLILE